MFPITILSQNMYSPIKTLCCSGHLIYTIMHLTDKQLIINECKYEKTVTVMMIKGCIEVFLFFLRLDNNSSMADLVFAVE